MQEIAAASGVGRTTVYRHFPAREDLLRALVAHVIAAERELFVNALAGGGTAADTLRRLARGAVEHGERYRFLGRHRDLVASPFDEPEPDEPLLAWLAEGRASGALRAELPPAWAFAIVVALIGAADRELARGHADLERAGALLGETLVGALVTAR